MGAAKHFTQKFEACAVTLTREMPVKRPGQILGESDTRMWRMLFANVKAAYQRLSDPYRDHSIALERCVAVMAYQMRLELQGIFERKDPLPQK